MVAGSSIFLLSSRQNGRMLKAELSQERAAELAGLSRQEFLSCLSRLGVSPFQGVEDDLASLPLVS